MKDLFLVASYTFKDLIKRKSFIISNIIILLIIVIGFNIPNIMNMIKDDDESFGKTKISIIDTENIYEGSLEQLKSLDTNYTIDVLNNITIDEVKEKIKSEEIQEAIIITKTQNGIDLNYLVKSIGMTSSIPQEFISILENTYKNVQLSKLNISQEQLSEINSPFTTQINQVEDKEASGNIFLMMMLCLVLFYAIYFYAYQVSSSITTEKTSKIIETLVTSTTPKTIVIGKTIGIGLAGILQTVVTVIVALICANIFLTPEMIKSVLDLSNITPMLAVVTIVYYILGYSLFALLYALTGSTVSKPEDIQSANGPVAILAVIGFYLSYFTMMNPASDLNSFASMFPISSPFCMPFRVMMGLANTTDVLISIAILLVTIYIVAKVSIKIYSSAILNYGTKIDLKSIMKLYKQKD